MNNISINNKLIEAFTNTINKLNNSQAERILENINIDERFLFTLLSFDLKFIETMNEQRKCEIISEMKKILQKDILSKIVLYDEIDYK